MTNRQMRSFCKWAGAIADEIGLRDWRINIHVAPTTASDGNDAAASVTVIYGRKIAHIEISPEFERLDPEEQRHVMVHEFLHIHTRQTRDLICESLPSTLGRPAFDSFLSGWTLLDEHAIDALASAIARFYPLWEGK